MTGRMRQVRGEIALRWWVYRETRRRRIRAELTKKLNAFFSLGTLEKD